MDYFDLGSKEEKRHWSYGDALELSLSEDNLTGGDVDMETISQDTVVIGDAKAFGNPGM